MTDQHNYSDNTAMQQSEDDPLEELARIVSGDYKSQPGANHWPRTTPTLPREARQTERPAMHAETQTAAPPQTDDFDLESELERELGASNVRALPEEPVEESVSDEQDESAHEDAGEAEAGPSGGDPLEDALALPALPVEARDGRYSDPRTHLASGFTTARFTSSKPSSVSTIAATAILGSSKWINRHSGQRLLGLPPNISVCM